jgi:hypothetical protein
MNGIAMKVPGCNWLIIMGFNLLRGDEIMELIS